MALTLGIAISASALAGSMVLHGHTTPLVADFSLAFLLVAGASMIAPLLSTGLEKGAGGELSGQRVQPTPVPPAPAEK
jgi:uncharacterized membrane protein YphA (DoxX/SURF4 family)